MSTDTSGVVAPAWRTIESGLPSLGSPVWLYEPNCGVYQGYRDDAGENSWEWRGIEEAWTNAKGEWCADGEPDATADPVLWMSFPDPNPLCMEAAS